MELRMNFTSFIKIKDASRINDICGEILDYSVTEDGVVGSLGINGKYYKNDLEKENQFNESIPFNIVFTTPKFELIDLDCVNLEEELKFLLTLRLSIMNLKKLLMLLRQLVKEP